MNERILDKISRDGTLQTLTRMELELDKLAVTTDPIPHPVSAWVRFGTVPVRVDAEACMWTATAVAIRFRADGREHKCWVWRGAVEEATAQIPKPRE
ncbi:hypothetical protein [Microbacterium aurum]